MQEYPLHRVNRQLSKEIKTSVSLRTTSKKCNVNDHSIPHSIYANGLLELLNNKRLLRNDESLRLIIHSEQDIRQYW